MQPEKAKQIINEILGNNIKFEGHFSKCFDSLKETQQKEIINWVKECKERKANPIQSKKKSEIIGFVKCQKLLLRQSAMLQLVVRTNNF